MPIPLQQFIEQLAASGVMPAADLQAFQASLSADKLIPEDFQPSVRELV
jgi:hypothetical protein